MPVQSEVFNLFSRFIPQEGLSRIEIGRKRAAIVPDFKFPGWKQGEDSFLAELKCLSSNPSQYPRNPHPSTRAVDRRASGLTAEYINKAKKCDRDHCGTQEGQIGPVQTRLQSFGEIIGFCFGRFGEMSEAVHELIRNLAKARASMPIVRRGYERDLTEEALIGVYTGQLRRTFSFHAMRSQARLLLDRLELLDAESNKDAAKRRRLVEAANRRAYRERHAQMTAVREGRAIIRWGRFVEN